MSKFSRKGVHKLECPMCDGAVYATVAVLESRGLPSCWCGETLQPTELELAMILGADESRPMMTYMRECNSVAKGQAAHGRAGRTLKRTPEEIAAERAERERVSLACWRQITALKPMPTPEPLPF
jgi:hypothetical protein